MFVIPCVFLVTLVHLRVVVHSSLSGPMSSSATVLARVNVCIKVVLVVLVKRFPSSGCGVCFVHSLLFLSRFASGHHVCLLHSRRTKSCVVALCA